MAAQDPQPGWPTCTETAMPDVPALTSVVNTADRAAGCLVAALEAAWATVRVHHPEIDPAVIIVASGTMGPTPRWGHFAACRWRRTVDGGRLAEILVAGEGLERGAIAVLGTLLHEAAHALAHARGVTDTSRQGRYHNARYRRLAEELGLIVEQVPVIGWSGTTVPPETAERYAAEIEAIAERLVIHRQPEPASARGAGARRAPGTAGTLRSGSCACPCGRRLRMAADMRAAGPVMCGVCGGEFAAEVEREP